MRVGELMFLTRVQVIRPTNMCGRSGTTPHLPYGRTGEGEMTYPLPDLPCLWYCPYQLQQSGEQDLPLTWIKL